MTILLPITVLLILVTLKSFQGRGRDDEGRLKPRESWDDRCVDWITTDIRKSRREPALMIAWLIVVGLPKSTTTRATTRVRPSRTKRTFSRPLVTTPLSIARTPTTVGGLEITSKMPTTATTGRTDGVRLDLD